MGNNWTKVSFPPVLQVQPSKPAQSSGAAALALRLSRCLNHALQTRVIRNYFNKL
jgi:hypothetical protein